MKNTNAKVRINSNITADGETTQMSMVSDAKYRCQNGKCYIMYEESITDDKQKSITTVKISDGDISIKRGGALDSTMKYQTGKSNMCLYNFDYGRIVIENYTHSIDVNLDEQGGIIDLHYDLDMGGAKSDNHMRITVEEVTTIEHNN